MTAGLAEPIFLRIEASRALMSSWKYDITPSALRQSSEPNIADYS